MWEKLELKPLSVIMFVKIGNVSVTGKCISVAVIELPSYGEDFYQ